MNPHGIREVDEDALRALVAEFNRGTERARRAAARNCPSCGRQYDSAQAVKVHRGRWGCPEEASS